MTRARGRRAWPVAALALAVLGSGCSQMASLGPASSAFQSGLATWDAFYLGQVYASSLAGIDHECFLSLYDTQRIAASVYGEVDPTTREEAANLVRVVFLDQRKVLGGAKAGVIRFDADDGQSRVVIPEVHAAFSPPVIGCPDRTPPKRVFQRQGNVEGMLSIDFPDRQRRVEVRARIAEGGSSLVSVPVLRSTAPSLADVPTAPVLTPRR